MTDTREAAEAALSSTLLDAGQPTEKPLSDAAFNAPPQQEEAPKAEEPKASSREALSKALDDVEAKEKPAEKAKEAPEAEKPKDEAAKTEDKPQKARAEDGKFAKADKPVDGDAKAEPGAADKAAQGQEAEAARQSEGRKHAEPPARFLPEARAKWANVPNEVKTEVHRVAQEYDAELERVRPAVEAYESVKEYDEMAKGAGTTMKDAMRNYVEIDKLLISSPAQGIARVLQAINITPEQLVDAITKNPNAFKVQAQPQPQQQPQVAPEVARLQEENQALRQHAIAAAARPIIDAFKADHPDYVEREPQVLAILKSGVVDQIYGSGLSPVQRLTEAYRMAGGTPPSQPVPLAAPTHSAPETDRPVDPAGQKSVRGAPSAGFDPQVRRPKSNREAAAAALDEVIGR